MSEMVERAAKAFTEELNLDEYPAINVRRAMRRAISAMRNPTKEMILSGAAQIPDDGVCGNLASSRAAWEDMIDTALADTIG